MDQFKSDVSEMKLKTGTASRDTLLQVSGALLMVVAVVVALITYSARAADASWSAARCSYT